MRLFYLLLLAIMLPLAAQSQVTRFVVNDPNDDANSRDKNPGDGVCEDFFTDSNPDAKPRCTLRAAIDEANATSGEVLIIIPNLLLGGVSSDYGLSRTAPNVADSTYEDNNAFGDLDLGGSFSKLTLLGTGVPGPTITQSPNDRIIDIKPGANVRLERLNLTGGTARAGTSGSPDGSGVGVDGEDGSDGGAVYVGEGAEVEIVQVSFTGNATQSGGNGASPSTSISRTEGGNAGNGGNGGALYIDSAATVSVSLSVFANNTAGDAGSPAAGQANSSMVPLDGGDGGNGGSGAAIYNRGTLSISHSTITANSAGDPSEGELGAQGGLDGATGEGGHGAVAQDSTATLTIINTIVSGNSAGDDTDNGKQPGMELFDFVSGATITSQGNNFIGTNDGVALAFPAPVSGNQNVNDDFVGTGSGDDPTILNAMLGSANVNADEAITTIPLLSGSPAIDQGTDQDADGDEVRIDARGFIRIAGAQADIGSYERDGVAPTDSMRINEVDVKTPDNNTEFVELKNFGEYTVQLDQYAVVIFGSDDQIGASFNLFGQLAPGDRFVLGDSAVANLDQRWEVSFAFEDVGATDSDATTVDEEVLDDVSGAIGIYKGKATDYPNGGQAGQNASTREDILVYDNSSADDAPAFGPSDEDGASLCGAFGQAANCAVTDPGDGASLQRNSSGQFVTAAPGPGDDTSPALPVAWQRVQATAEGDRGLVQWATLIEEHSDYFEVFISRDGKSWASAAEPVAAAGYSYDVRTYHILTERLRPGTYYAYVLQVDLDGKQDQSEMVSFTIADNTTATAMLLSPNPARSHVEVRLSTPAAAQLYLADVNGRILHTQQLNGDRTTIAVEQLPAGVYYVRYVTATQSIVEPLVIAR